MRIITLFITLLTCISMMHSQEKILVEIGANRLTATLADNSATEKLRERLSKEPVTITMHDYGGFEKVGELPWSLPQTDRPITTEPGDIMLYLGDNIVFFYGRNSWDYTPIGKFDNVDEMDLKSILSGSNISVTISLDPTSGIGIISSPDNHLHEVYDLQGRRMMVDGGDLSSLPEGIYIVDGKKRIVSHR